MGEALREVEVSKFCDGNLSGLFRAQGATPVVRIPPGEIRTSEIAVRAVLVEGLPPPSGRATDDDRTVLGGGRGMW